MKRFAIVVALAIALNVVLAVSPIAVGAVSANLYVVWALSFAGAFALYAAVLVVMRIRRRRDKRS